MVVIVEIELQFFLENVRNRALEKIECVKDWNYSHSIWGRLQGTLCLELYIYERRTMVQGDFCVVKVCKQVMPMFWRLGDRMEPKKLLNMGWGISGQNK